MTLYAYSQKMLRAILRATRSIIPVLPHFTVTIASREKKIDKRKLRAQTREGKKKWKTIPLPSKQDTVDHFPVWRPEFLSVKNMFSNLLQHETLRRMSISIRGGLCASSLLLSFRYLSFSVQLCSHTFYFNGHFPKREMTSH